MKRLLFLAAIAMIETVPAQSEVVTVNETPSNNYCSELRNECRDGDWKSCRLYTLDCRGD